jgi:hypothetical protein
VKTPLAVTMLNEKVSLFVVSVTDVAVIVGEAFAPVGAVVGGVYVAEKLGAALAVSVPHVGEQAAPPTVNAQVTPAFAASFVTTTFIVTVGPLTVCVANLFEIVTTMGGEAIVKLKLEDFDGSATDAAAIVGEAFVPVGAVAGGVYAAVRLGDALGVRVPQAGEQLAPPAVSVQEIPELVTSLVMVAVRFTVGPPAVCVVNVGAMLTPMGGVI